MIAAMCSSRSEHYRTLPKFYAELDAEFRFDLDPCPYQSEADGLSISWSGKRVFCNPPYGSKKMRPFLEKASEAELAVFLIPARTDTKWFHDLVLHKASEIRFLSGRTYFEKGCRAPFPVMLVIYRAAPSTEGKEKA